MFALMVGMQPQTFINELPHPRMAIHFHPTAGQFKLDDLKFALDHKVNAVELDLHLRDGEVVCNHDSATPESPTLRQALDMVFRTQGRDGLQFLVVLELKENSRELFDAILKVLEDYRMHLSTSSERLSKPRDVTVVITGSYPLEFYSHFPPETVNRFCIAERHDYTGEITNLSGQRFQWVSIKHSTKPGEDARRVRALHDGTDPAIPGKFNVRIWDCHADLEQALTSGADSLNCDRDELEAFQRVLHKKSH